MTEIAQNSEKVKLPEKGTIVLQDRTQQVPSRNQSKLIEFDFLWCGKQQQSAASNNDSNILSEFVITRFLGYKNNLS